jgi:hypothetical protein
MGDDERGPASDADPTPEDGGDGDVSDIACHPLEVPEDEEPVRACLEEEVRVVAEEYPEAQDVRTWPRRVIKLDGVRRLYLHTPGEVFRQSSAPVLTIARFNDYINTVGRQEPRIDSAGSWGQHERVALKVAHLEEVNGLQELRFDGQHEWTFDIYNLLDVQPAWPRMVKRTLMGFPIEILRELKLRVIYLDFMVGTNTLGPIGDTGPHARPGVIQGGCNWRYWDTRADTGGDSGLCVTYAALNRVWTRRASRGRLSNDDVDAAYTNSRRRLLADTLYHEAGHLYQWLRRNPYPTTEMRDALHDNELWNQYRIDIGYAAGGGRSQGAGEGFAEAFKYRLRGRRKLPRSNGQAAEDALDAARLPTLDSVRALQETLDQHAANL